MKEQHHNDQDIEANINYTKLSTNGRNITTVKASSLLSEIYILESGQRMRFLWIPPVIVATVCRSALPQFLFLSRLPSDPGQEKGSLFLQWFARNPPQGATKPLGNAFLIYQSFFLGDVLPGMAKGIKLLPVSSYS